VTYLLDVYVLDAWGWADPADHRRVAPLIAAMKGTDGTGILTSSIPELGFIRVSLLSESPPHRLVSSKKTVPPGTCSLRSFSKSAAVALTS
jgi:hypothetical protein